jgi:hypothetical protein
LIQDFSITSLGLLFCINHCGDGGVIGKEDDVLKPLKKYSKKERWCLSFCGRWVFFEVAHENMMQ